MTAVVSVDGTTETGTSGGGGGGGNGDGSPRRGPPPRRARRGHRSQVAALASLVALPLLVYGVPALLGHPVVPGDDLTQNLPLRELVGQDLRAGHLPIFDPYIWGGAPLLAGWNAGAAYPLTWLFAVLPGSAAWTLNLVAAGWAAGLGLFAFLRASRLGVLASWAGATTFVFGGGMVAQVPHVGLIAGMSWVPLGLLALLRLTEAPFGLSRARAGWTALLATAVALVGLSGEPRAATDGAVVLLLYALWRLVGLARASWRAGVSAAATTLVGAGVGVGLSAVQILPGLAAVATSQRAQTSGFLFGAGSMPARWLTLLGVPDLLGGSGSFGQPAFFAHYNLTEVTGYVGLLPLAAAAALLARRARGPDGGWVVWELVVVVGILLALGNQTPLWHLLVRVPLLGGQRLQSRALLVTDLGLAICLAYWLDGWVPSRRTHRGQRVLAAVPLVGVAGLLVAASADGAPILRWLGAGTRAGAHAVALRPWLAPSLVLALGALTLVVAGHRLSPAARAGAVTCFVLADLLVFNATTIVAVDAPAAASGQVAAPSHTAAPGHAAAPGRAATHPALGRNGTTTANRRSGTDGTIGTRPISELHLTGRFAVYDPDLADAAQLAALGVPDGSVLAKTWSVQGYGSIVDGRYAAVTGVHGLSGSGQDVFAPRAARDGTFDALSTQAVLTLSRYLRTPIPRDEPLGARPRIGALDPARASGTRRLDPGRRATWFVGAPLPLASALVETTTSTGTPTRALPAPRIGAVTRAGNLAWASVQAAPPGAPPARASGRWWRATWRQPVEAVALVVERASRGLAWPPVVTARGRASYALDGVLQGAFEPPHWAFGGMDGAFTVLVDRRAEPPLSLRPVAGTSLRGAVVRRISGPRLDPRAALVDSPRGAEVVRAVAAVPGWTATWHPLHGSAGSDRSLVVHRLGPVQVVRVPAGRGIVTWRYVAPGLLAGELVSAAALLVLLALLALAALPRRRAAP